ncbi:hypothetical protein GCM10009630_34920 [Kribbella jejuensis]
MQRIHASRPEAHVGVTVDEARHQQRACAVDALVAVQSDPHIGNAIVGKHNIGRPHVTRTDIKHRARMQDPPTHAVVPSSRRAINA